MEVVRNSFTVKVTLPLSTSAAQTYVGARYLRRSDAIWELPTTSHVESIQEEHGMTNANPVVTLALARNDDDEDKDKASTEEHRILRRVVGKSQFLAPRTPEIAFATNRLARSQAKRTKGRPPRLETAFCVVLWHGGYGFEAAHTQQCVHDPDSFHRQRWSVRPTHTKIRFLLMGDHARWSIDWRWWTNTVGDLPVIHVKPSTSQPQQPRGKQSTSRLCSWRAGRQYTYIFVPTATVPLVWQAEEVLQRFRHLDVRFLWLQAEIAANRVATNKVLGQTFARVLSYVYGSYTDPETVSISSPVTALSSFPVSVSRSHTRAATDMNYTSCLWK